MVAVYPFQQSGRRQSLPKISKFYSPAMTETIQPMPMARLQDTQQESQPESGSYEHPQKEFTDQSFIDDFLHVSSEEMRASFREIWSDTISDHRLTLFGFRRYRTTHLVNLRYLELELEKISNVIFQAGMQLDQPPSDLDRLGLRYIRKQPGTSAKLEIINGNTILRLRELIKEYGLWSLLS